MVGVGSVGIGGSVDSSVILDRWGTAIEYADARARNGQSGRDDTRGTDAGETDTAGAPSLPPCGGSDTGWDRPKMPRWVSANRSYFRPTRSNMFPYKSWNTATVP
jgi:hypothetical protein